MGTGVGRERERDGWGGQDDGGMDSKMGNDAGENVTYKGGDSGTDSKIGNGAGERQDIQR